jgi:hypothetical protein
MSLAILAGGGDCAGLRRDFNPGGNRAGVRER